MAESLSVADSCRNYVQQWLRADPQELSEAPAHAGQGSEPLTLEDHLLTTSALVCCLAEHLPDDERDTLRLAALLHDLPAEKRANALASAPAEAERLVALLREHGELLARGDAARRGQNEAEQILLYAHLAASRREPVAASADFATHPLANAGKVGVVFGGATRIKGYVFESARLPEIRGASALLDHINQVDLPALWGLPPAMTTDPELQAQQHLLYEETRRWFVEEFPQARRALDAPECVIFANGGNLLALTPPGWEGWLADAIERRYTAVTGTAKSVAVGRCFDLLELQYGRAPAAFWTEEAKALASTHAEAARLQEQSRSNDAQDEPFEAQKGFGELITHLAAEANRRRSSNSREGRQPYLTSFIELSSQAHKCSSCDERPAVEHWTGRPEAFLCEPCLWKRRAGIRARKGADGTNDYNWIRPWGLWLEEQIERSVAKTTDDLRELAEASADGFVGLIYADGNNVGAYLASLQSVSGYRRFSRKLLLANEKAVAESLKVLQPNRSQSPWPFEVITIGGDDVLLFVPADKAMTIAAAIAQQFGSAMAAENISLSAGVLIMSESMPVRFARELVEQLLYSAKRPKVAAIDFMAMKGVTMLAESLEGYRRVAQRRGGAQQESGVRPSLSLTQRPYTLDRLALLLETIRALKSGEFPRSQLYQIASYLEAGLLLRSAVDFAYLVDRGKRRNPRPFNTFEQHMATLCGGRDLLPWRRKKDEAGTITYDTPLEDIIELYPFIQQAKAQSGPRPPATLEGGAL